jgi:hypothetical protein
LDFDAGLRVNLTTSFPQSGMLRIMRNSSFQETKLIDELSETLKSLLPEDWSIDLLPPDRRYSTRPDAVFKLSSLDNQSAVVIVEVKGEVAPKNVPWMLSQVNQYPADATLILAPYLTDRARDLIVENGANYADSTGNLRLKLARPALFLQTSGATENPWRVERVVKTLRGPISGRGVRALCELSPPYGVRELAERAGMQPGTISKLLAFLDTEALITRGDRGQVVSVDWQALVRRWASDYAFAQSNSVHSVLEPRGLGELERKLVGSQLRYSVTGSVAAVLKAPIAPPRLAMVYVESAAEAIRKLKLVRAEAGTNVILAEPYDPIVFERTWIGPLGLICAGLSQVAVDLLTGPGRSPNEAEALLTWMAANEHDWRT